VYTLFFVGSGDPDDLLARKCRLAQLTLANVQKLSSGVVILSYQCSPTRPA
jgi:hypothetical protein